MLDLKKIPIETILTSRNGSPLNFVIKYVPPDAIAPGVITLISNLIPQILNLHNCS